MSDFAVIAENLSVIFGDFHAVDNISFQVKRGEIFGFLGANGAGKTTTIRGLCGLIHPRMGTVKVCGTDFNTAQAEMQIKQKVGYMSQKFTLYNDLTVEDNLSFIASLRKIDNETYLKRRDYLLNFIDFSRPLDSLVQDLPGGIKQQISLVASLLHEPEIIFLDEPTAGVTPVMRARFWDLINDLIKLGKTIFVTTHYMDEAEHCHRIALMRMGKIIAMDTPENLKQSTFTHGFYEFESLDKTNISYIQELKHRQEFVYFEPFGLRFHAAFAQNSEATLLKEQLKKNFKISEIRPSLEDVFISMIESKSA
jgi:ABC-2 type transport system ATP-binding protein